MLQTQAVYPATLELLKKLMGIEPLASFDLVGGTSLALQYGHRISVDLDFFSKDEFNVPLLKKEISQHFPNESVEWENESKATLIGYINDVKIDIIRYPYPIIGEVKVIDGIRLYTADDIAPMKLSAIAQRGSKKDYFDFYELLENGYTLDMMIEQFRKKYDQTDVTHVLRSLTFFEDAEIQEDPIMIKKYSWDDVKKRANLVFKDYVNRHL